MSFKNTIYNYTLVLLSVVLLPNFSSAQIKDSLQYKATYRLNFQPSKDSIQKKEDMLLFIGDDFTVFSSLGKHKKDSLLRNKKNNKSNFVQAFRSLPKTKFKYTIINKLNSPKLFYNQKIAKDNFIYEENISPKWKISSESKTVAGYKCQKAEITYAGRDYTAWFTPEIPISAGPYKFSGLPGLIVELYDSKKEYHFKLIELLELEKPIALDFSKINKIETDKETFQQVIKKFNNNPFKTLEQSGITIDFEDDSRKKKMLEEHKEKQRNKNPIELKPTF